MFNPHVITLVLDEAYDDRVSAVCSCGEYRSTRPMSREWTERYTLKHLQGMARRFANPWRAVLVDVGPRRISGHHAVQVLLSTISQGSTPPDRVNQVVSLNLSRTEARELGERLIGLSIEKED
jgi:hypothetical protein